MSRDTFPAKIRALEPFSGRFDAFRLRARGCDVLFAVYPAGTRIDPHTHASDNWGVVTRGKMLLRVNGSELSLAAGDWYHVPARTEHSARCEIDTEQIEFWFKAGLPRRSRRARRAPNP